MKAFISYSHKDETYVDRLKVHLVQMKRERLIEDWTDKEIHAGSNLEDVINSALESSELFLALLSPDYIASNYCFDKEFETAQKMQLAGKLTIVPIVVEPCDWQKSPFGKLKALPKDGKAISEWTNPNNAFLNVIDELRHFTSKLPTSASNEVVDTSEKLVRNYKVKKHFSEVDNYNFKESSFDQIKKYFQSSIAELNFVENLQVRFINEDKGYFTCLISNRANNQSSFVTIQMGSEVKHHFGDLSYSFSEKINPNSIQMDRIFSIANNDYEQFWTKSSRNFNFSNQDALQLNAHEVAEQIWNDFISQVGVSLE